MRKIIGAAVVTVVLSLAIYGIGHSRHRADISRRPERAAPGIPKPQDERESSVAVNAFLSYASLAAAIEKDFPAQISESGQGEEMTHPLHSFIGPGPGVAVGYRWSILVERGSVTVSRVGNRLRAAVPVSVSGWGGLRGDGAKLLGLDRKNARGAISLYLDVDANITENWEPEIKATPHFNWTQPAQVEAIGGVWVDVSGSVNGKINDALIKAVADAQNSIDKQALRNALAPQWRTRRLKLGTYAGNDIVTTITPSSAGFSGVEYQATGIDFSLSLKGTTKTVLAKSSAIEADAPPTELPKLEVIPASSSELTMDLPVYVSYDALRSAAMNQVSAKGYSGKTPLGEGTVYIEDVQAYPTLGGQLAVGVKLKGKFEHRLFDVNGWIWLTAKVSLAQERQAINFDGIKFTNALDNQLWEAVLSVLNQPIRDILNRNSSVNFTNQLKDLEDQLQRIVNDPGITGGAQFSIQNFKLLPGEVVLSSDTIGVSALVKANVSCEIQTLQVH